MPWVRLDDNAMDHPKVVALHDGAFRLWVQGLAYCQRFLTDGFIEARALRTLRAYSPKRYRDLVEVRLWDETERGGVQVHDYLDWNESKDHVIEARRYAKIRMALVRDPKLRKALQARDGNACRYCGCSVNWLDRKGPNGATYDHVVPGGPDDIDNLVVACRACNSRKGSRTPEQAGMALRPTRSSGCNQGLESGSDLDKSSYHTTPIPHPSQPRSVRKEHEPTDARVHAKLTALGTNPELTERAGRFLERYGDLHEKHRRGARYVGRMHVDYQEALQLVATYDDERLDKLATVWLTTNHDFAEGGTRTIPKFRSMASWCDERLRERGL